jgi:hypothetical protein
MPRSSSFKSSSHRSVAPAPVPFHAAKPVHLPPPPPTVTPVSYAPSFGQSIKDGFGLGIGSSIARNLVDGWFHRPAAPTTQVTPELSSVVSSGLPVKTELQKKEYIQCMQTINDHAHCKKLMEETS